MNIENLETASNFYKRLKELRNVKAILENWPAGSKITVSYQAGTQKEASITDTTLNGLLYGAIDKLIDDIESVVKTL